MVAIAECNSLKGCGNEKIRRSEALFINDLVFAHGELLELASQQIRQGNIVLIAIGFLEKFANSTEKGVENHMQVIVRDNNVDQALRVLKKKLQREGLFREMKLKQHFEKPSEKKARTKGEAIRRARKLARKKLEREG